jgi:hypothetical protein
MEFGHAQVVPSQQRAHFCKSPLLDPHSPPRGVHVALTHVSLHGSGPEQSMPAQVSPSQHSGAPASELEDWHGSRLSPHAPAAARIPASPALPAAPEAPPPIAPEPAVAVPPSPPRPAVPPVRSWWVPPAPPRPAAPPVLPESPPLPSPAEPDAPPTTPAVPPLSRGLEPVVPALGLPPASSSPRPAAPVLPPAPAPAPAPSASVSGSAHCLLVSEHSGNTSHTARSERSAHCSSVSHERVQRLHTQEKASPHSESLSHALSQLVLVSVGPFASHATSGRAAKRSSGSRRILDVMVGVPRGLMLFETRHPWRRKRPRVRRSGRSRRSPCRLLLEEGSVRCRLIRASRAH